MSKVSSRIAVKAPRVEPPFRPDLFFVKIIMVHHVLDICNVYPNTSFIITSPTSASGRSIAVFVSRGPRRSKTCGYDTHCA